VALMMEEKYDDLAGLRERAQAEVSKVVIGQDRTVELLLIAAVSHGHVLLEGPPGSAKTLLARATAGECGVPFVNVRIEDVVDPYQGVSERNLHEAFEWPRVQTLHFYGSFWPHDAGFNKLNVEANVPDAVYEELKRRGHDVGRLPVYGMSGCATAVIVDPATQNRIAGADPRRDCYAMAY